MRKALRIYSLAAAIFTFADPSWSGDAIQKSPWLSKPISAWSEEEANQILVNSPWCKRATLALLPSQGEDARRNGGDMSSPKGVGYEEIEDGPPKSKKDGVSIFLPSRAKEQVRAARIVQVRWETALPVRAAEMKTHILDPPSLEGDGAVLAVYGVPGRFFNGTPKSLGAPLKKYAVLKREGKRDLHATRVEVFQRDHDLVIAYLFPALEDSTEGAKILHFEAHIGRFAINQAFSIDEMRFKGKLEM